MIVLGDSMVKSSAISATLFLTLAMGLFASGEGVLRPAQAAEPRPFDVHLAKGEDGNAHVHLYIRHAGVSEVDIDVLDAGGAIVQEVSLVPAYAATDRAEALIKLSPDIATIAHSVKVSGFASKMARPNSSGTMAVFEISNDATPMAGCTGFCIGFRRDCNNYCWGPPCCGYIVEGTYWCGGDYPDCGGNCECECPLPCWVRPEGGDQER